MKKPENIPVPLTEDDKIKTYKKAQLFIFLTTIILAELISYILVISMLIFLFLIKLVSV